MLHFEEKVSQNQEIIYSAKYVGALVRGSGTVVPSGTLTRENVDPGPLYPHTFLLFLMSNEQSEQ